jgi:hypothetical protein
MESISAVEMGQGFESYALRLSPAMALLRLLLVFVVVACLPTAQMCVSRSRPPHSR